MLAKLMDERDRVGIVRHLQRARSRQVDDALRHDAARPCAHDQNTIGQQRCFAQIVRDENDRRFSRQPKLLQGEPQLLPSEHVERSERLVQHQQGGIMDERPAERGALLHAPGQLPGKVILKSLEADQSEKIARLRLISGSLALEPLTMRLHDLER